MPPAREPPRRFGGGAAAAVPARDPVELLQYRLRAARQRRVFAPLGMRDTGYDVNRPRLPGHASGYASPGKPAPYIDMSAAYSAGALYSTIDDLARWDNALLSGGAPGIPARAHTDTAGSSTSTAPSTTMTA